MINAMRRVSRETDHLILPLGSLYQSHSLTPPLGGETETETAQGVRVRIHRQQKQNSKG